jgi:threonyl-tRNA synthetase
MERFIAVLLEHTGGNLPVWLTPEQAIILPVSEKYNEYATQLKDKLNDADIRTVLDERDEKVGRKILDAEKVRYPYMLVVGAKEQESGGVSIRRKGVEKIQEVTFDEFVDIVKNDTELLVFGA